MGCLGGGWPAPEQEGEWSSVGWTDLGYDTCGGCLLIILRFFKGLLWVLPSYRIGALGGVGSVDEFDQAGGFDSRHPWRSVLRTASGAGVQNGCPAVL